MDMNLYSLEIQIQTALPRLNKKPKSKPESYAPKL